MSDPAEMSWELLTFFALGAEQQERLIGPAQEWFCKEDTAINPGANYLLGLVYAFSGYRNGFVDSADADDRGAIFELNELFNSMLQEKKDYFWSIDQLHKNPVWREVRHLAALVLDQVGLGFNPPSKPFFIPELLEVNGYPMRGLPSSVPSKPSTSGDR